MNLTKYTDYGFRVLTYLALLPKSQLTSVDELSEVYNISRNNLNKIVHQLSKAGVVQTKKGKGGGLKLAMPAELVNLGQLLELMESTLDVVDCQKPICKIAPACQLKSILAEATKAFIEVLKQYSLADLTSNKNNDLKALLQIPIVLEQ